MTRRLAHEEHGQAVLFTVLFLVVLLGATALTLDVGVWYREQRQAQATADQAVLSGAQSLPTTPTAALTDAQTYADANGGGVVAGSLKLQSQWMPNDTVTVKVNRTAPSFFAKIFAMGNVTVGATATARSGIPQGVSGAAPIVVNKLHPKLAGVGCPCFNQETTIPLGKTGAPGAFGFVDFDNAGSKGSTDLASWILHGYDGTLERGPYDSDPGAKFNGNGILDALNQRLGDELLFPVYDTLTGNGSNAQYNVIGWVAFHLDCVGLVVGDTDCVNHHGNNDSLTGYFTKVIWTGIQSKTNQNYPDFGVYVVELTN